jgi:hypothetical protein
MKKPEHWSQPTTRVHESRDDRARTRAGKTADSKVRSEGRHLAALEHNAETKVRHQATESKNLATAERSETAEAVRP